MDALRNAVADALRRVFDPVLRGWIALGGTPNQLTVLGLLVTLAAAGLYAWGEPLAAGIVFLVGSGVDMFDGLLARRTGRVSRFGAFLDSVLDRVGEGAMLLAIAWVFASRAEALPVAAAFLTLLGGMLTSYARARAEGLGIECRGGLVQRPERVVLLGAAIILGLEASVLYLLAVVTAWTAAQRVWHVRTALAGEGDGSGGD